MYSGDGLDSKQTLTKGSNEKSMQKTKHGIPYVESTDYREDFPEHMKLMAEAIDLLFDKVFRRIDEAENILALLKEQESVEPRRDANCVRIFRCGACGEYVGFIDSDPGDTNEQDNYCRNCGRKVKWDA